MKTADVRLKEDEDESLRYTSYGALASVRLHRAGSDIKEFRLACETSGRPP